MKKGKGPLFFMLEKRYITERTKNDKQQCNYKLEKENKLYQRKGIRNNCVLYKYTDLLLFLFLIFILFQASEKKNIICMYIIYFDIYSHNEFTKVDILKYSPRCFRLLSDVCFQNQHDYNSQNMNELSSIRYNSREAATTINRNNFNDNNLLNKYQGQGEGQNQRNSNKGTNSNILKESKIGNTSQCKTKCLDYDLSLLEKSFQGMSFNTYSEKGINNEAYINNGENKNNGNSYQILKESINGNPTITSTTNNNNIGNNSNSRNYIDKMGKSPPGVHIKNMNAGGYDSGSNSQMFIGNKYDKKNYNDNNYNNHNNYDLNGYNNKMDGRNTSQGNFQRDLYVEENSRNYNNISYNNYSDHREYPYNNNNNYYYYGYENTSNNHHNIAQGNSQRISVVERNERTCPMPSNYDTYNDPYYYSYYDNNKWNDDFHVMEQEFEKIVYQKHGENFSDHNMYASYNNDSIYRGHYYSPSNIEDYLGTIDEAFENVHFKGQGIKNPDFNANFNYKDYMTGNVKIDLVDSSDEEFENRYNSNSSTQKKKKKKSKVHDSRKHSRTLRKRDDYNDEDLNNDYDDDINNDVDDICNDSEYEFPTKFKDYDDDICNDSEYGFPTKYNDYDENCYETVGETKGSSYSDNYKKKKKTDSMNKIVKKDSCSYLQYDKKKTENKLLPVFESDTGVDAKWSGSKENKNDKSNNEELVSFEENYTEQEINDILSKLNEFVSLKDMFIIFNHVKRIERKKFLCMEQDINGYIEKLIKTNNVPTYIKRKCMAKVNFYMTNDYLDLEERILQNFYTMLYRGSMSKSKFIQLINEQRGYWLDQRRQLNIMWKDIMERRMKWYLFRLKKDKTIFEWIAFLSME
ncbi:exported protein (PHISTc) [Plasmodium reichenowi]|uniref:Exported protein (PHISTc) n=1 Tax=Plasmodium reichenowi TaxID=5854 RepID=A0A151LF91_PLARE|nr:exported protein (PHISTc) [Plasmodium reichenowi]KYN97620.1 exported protein (PHISTc) [Plasmodium reichenowi]